MKYSLPVVCAVACLATGVVVADDEVDESKPIELTVTQMDQVTAGVGANNVAVAPWAALLPLGFSLNHNSNTDGNHAASLGGVAVPVAIPNSFCFAFCP